jgi:hypothetical protein
MLEYAGHYTTNLRVRTLATPKLVPETNMIHNNHDLLQPSTIMASFNLIIVAYD